MRAHIESRFESIASNALSEAEGVKCDFAEFVEGLEIVVETLQERLDCSKEELSRRGEP